MVNIYTQKGPKMSLDQSLAIIADIVRLYEDPLVERTWHEIADYIAKKYKIPFHSEAARGRYRRHRDSVERSPVDMSVETLKTIARSRRTSGRNSRENLAILDYLNNQEDIIEQISGLVDKYSGRKMPKPEALPRAKKSDQAVTMELLFSDLHMGKKSEIYDHNIARDRIAQITYRVLREMDIASSRFCVERLVIASLGDLIESASMHGIESARGCEFDNARQVYESIDAIIDLMLIPLAQSGIPIDFVGVAGNHDRYDHKRTYAKPGETNLSYIVYKTLEKFSDKLGLGIKFDIPTTLHAIYEIYGNVVVYEHGDETAASSRVALEKRMSDLQEQLGRFIHFYRVAHYHSFNMYDRGRIIVNEAICGPDSYSVCKGHNSHAGQTLNLYHSTNTRPTSFYRTFPIYLK